MRTKRVVLSMVFTGLLFAISLATQAAEPICVQAKQWVETNRAHLPKTYDEFLRLPLAYQSAVFNALSAEVKAELWRTHLTRYREQHPKLSRAKVELIDKALAFIDQPTTFETPQSDPLWKVLVGGTVAELEREFRARFGPGEAMSILGRLGGENPSSRHVFEVDPAGDKAVLQCSCSTQSDWCDPSPYRCYTTNPSCSSTSSGCGTFWSYPCNGTCQNRS